MTTHGTDRVPSIKQFKAFLGFVVAVVTEIAMQFFFRLSPDEAKALLQNKATLEKKIKSALAPVFGSCVIDEYAEQRAYWENFYRKHFGMDADFGAVNIPEKPSDGRWRLIFIPKGLTMNQAAEAYRKILVMHDASWSLWRYTDDLDAAIPNNIRTSVQSYAVWVRGEQESDHEFRGQSTREADPDQLIGVTVLERLVHGAVHFVETKQHLDHVGVTLCSGSRGTDGNVPNVHWSPGSRTVDVYWRGLDDSSRNGGVRRAVS